MSQQKDIFFQLLTPSIERLGYTFKKSKGIYVKTIGDLDYIIEFSWDGRGGATHLNCVFGTISMPSIIKASAFVRVSRMQFRSFVRYETRRRNSNKEERVFTL